jgi:hypothetical protein
MYAAGVIHPWSLVACSWVLVHSDPTYVQRPEAPSGFLQQLGSKEKEKESSQGGLVGEERQSV